MNVPNQEVRQQILSLMQQKEDIEKNIRDATEILNLNGVGMDDPLVDNEGFPINSIDIYSVRHARHRINCLRNDHRDIMKAIEAGLQNYYASDAPQNSRSNGSTNGHVEPNVEMLNGLDLHEKKAFVRIGKVEAGSPADLAGLCERDEIIEFGSINCTNYRNLNDLARVVNHSENQEIAVRLNRKDNHLTRGIIPKKWQGQGLLGCQLLPLSD